MLTNKFQYTVPTTFHFKHYVHNLHFVYRSTSYSQAGQDLFVVAVFQGKTQGTYLEIGAGDPEKANNTLLLEQTFKYSGISIDNNPQYLNDWIRFRPHSNFIFADAVNYDYSQLPKYFDYLQVDVDPPMNNLRVLQKVLQHCSFGAITFEHDLWRNTDEVRTVKFEAQELLRNSGYELLVNNVTLEPELASHPINDPMFFEDWYVNPNIISHSVIATYKDLSDLPKYKRSILFK